MSAFRNTKSYDLLVASPLIVIELLGAMGILVRIASDLHALRVVSLTSALNLMALFALIGFALSQTYWLFARKTPQRFSENLLSRAVAITSANIGICTALLPQASISPATQVLSSFLMCAGAATSTYVMAWLGNGFSILPQARTLVVKGPYRLVRHPLYLCETVTTVGLALQYLQPWALLLAVGTTAIQFWRMHYEERILVLQFPAYRDYAAQTAKFVPGIV